jgi:copper chaperone
MSNIIHFTVTGEFKINCSGCEQRITRALRRIPGIRQVTARSEDQRIVVTYEAALVGAEQLRAKLGEIGYEVAHEDGTE